MENELDLDNPINVLEDDPGQPQNDLTAKIKELESKMKETDEKNKQLFERAKKAEEKIKEIKPVEPEPKIEPKGDESWKNKIDFLLSNSDKKYSEEEFEHIALIADRKRLSLSEAAKIEENYIQFNRDKVAKEKKIPESGNVPGGESHKAITPDDMEKDPDAHRKVFDEFLRTGEIKEQGI